MELLLISDGKLKVVLTADDMKKYDLTCESIDYDNTETRRAFWSILDEAKHRTGFDAAQDKVFIQVYPSRSGGCEMFVTRMEDKSLALTADTGKPSRCVFGFDRADYLRAAVRGIGSAGKDAEIFYGKRGYYLVIPEDDVRKIEGHLVEYGSRLSASSVCLYIKEHCERLNLTLLDKGRNDYGLENSRRRMQ